MIADIRAYLKSATFRRYWSDWTVAFVLAAYFYFIAEQARPFARQFSLDDLSIQHPFATVERVSGPQCLLIAFFVPVTTIIVVSLASKSANSNWVHKLQITLLGLALSLTVNGVVTDTLKNWIGRPRPDFLARCGPAKGTPTSGFVDISVCTAPLGPRRLIDGMRSAPLGHSSISFSAMLYLTLWLVGHFKLLQRKKPVVGVLAASTPLLIAARIALTRTQDYRHHFSDIVLGSIIGCFFAVVLYRRFFPSLLSEDAGMIEGEEMLPV